MTEISEKDKKEKLLQEKRERRMLERLTVYRERTFRDSTMKIKKLGSEFYSEKLKTIPKKISHNSYNEIPKKSKKVHKNSLKSKQSTDNQKTNGKLKTSMISEIISKDHIIDMNSKNIAIEEEPEGNRCFTNNDFEKNNSEVNNNNNGHNTLSVSLENIDNNYLDSQNSILSNKKNIKQNEIKDDSNEMSVKNINGTSDDSKPDKLLSNCVNLIDELKKTYPSEIDFYEKNKNYNHNGTTNYNTTLNTKTFINCDLRFFNLDLIVNRIGYFDVLLIDPPWRIKGGQRNDWSFMFSNSKFNLEYNTLSNNDIISLPLEKLSKKGKFSFKKAFAFFGF